MHPLFWGMTTARGTARAYLLFTWDYFICCPILSKLALFCLSSSSVSFSYFIFARARVVGKTLVHEFISYGHSEWSLLFFVERNDPNFGRSFAFQKLNYDNWLCTAILTRRYYNNKKKVYFYYNYYMQVESRILTLTT